MTDHPLTDEMIDEIQMRFDGFCFECHDDMRAAYNLAIEHVYEVWNQISEEADFDSTICWRFSHRLKKMRPQVVDLPQANSDVCGEEGIRRARQLTFEENDELMCKLADS